jgi:glutamate-5-semialdehyde dehydrogenase
MSDPVDQLAPELLANLELGRRAARELRAATPEQKNRVLEEAARLLARRAEEVIAANAEDLTAFDAVPERPGAAALRDRLLIDRPRIDQMVEGLRQVAALADPVGEVVESRVLDNGLRIRRVRSPLGVILMIFESRPNVAIEAFSLAFKAGNSLILRGGKESMRTTAVLYELLRSALASERLSPGALWGITDADRRITETLLRQRQWIDVVVPRGGDGLIDFVVRHSLIPIIKNDRGLCHVYVHEDADPQMAIEIAVNAKTQRPGVCNAMETLLVDEAIAARLLPALHDRISQPSSDRRVEWFGCDRTCALLKGRDSVSPAGPQSFDTEYLDFKMNCRVVDSFESAVDHIERHGSRHSESIITRSRELAHRFQQEIDAAAVYWNASTRFTDGFSLGLGGELGISTQKLHVRGPVGLRELTSVRWVMEGTGQVRER